MSKILVFPQITANLYYIFEGMRNHASRILNQSQNQMSIIVGET